MQLAFSSICSERISCTCLLKLHYTFFLELIKKEFHQFNVLFGLESPTCVSTKDN